MTYTIIEDCSPYYIRFKHTGIENLIHTAQSKIVNYKGTPDVFHHKLDYYSGLDILNVTPLKDIFTFQRDRVSFLVTKPNARSNIHIDHASISINYGISILDTQCTTSWYDNESIDNTFNPVCGMPYNRFVVNHNIFHSNPVTPIKSFTHIQGECVLINTDLYHDFNNSSSHNERIILTLRIYPHDSVNFNDASKLLLSTQAR